MPAVLYFYVSLTVGLGHDFQKKEEGLLDEYCMEFHSAFVDRHDNTCTLREISLEN